MIKDGEDGHGLQTTILKNVGRTFQDAQTVTNSFECNFKGNLFFSFFMLLFSRGIESLKFEFTTVSKLDPSFLIHVYYAEDATPVLLFFRYKSL